MKVIFDTNAYRNLAKTIFRTDSDAENAETQSWLEYSLACHYIFEEVFNDLTNKSIEVGKLLSYMMNNPDKFS